MEQENYGLCHTVIILHFPGLPHVVGGGSLPSRVQPLKGAGALDAHEGPQQRDHENDPGLPVLEGSGPLTKERRGMSVHYRVVPEAIRGSASALGSGGA